MNCEPIVSTWIRSHRGPNSHVGGFTLLEILVAMSIFAIVMGLIFGTFEGVFSNADHVNAGSGIYEMADACIERITADLQEIHVTQQPRYKIPDMDSEPDLYRVEGKNESIGGGTFARLRFASLAHLPISGDAREGIAEIVYYAQEVENGTYVIRRADRLYPYPEEFEPDETDPVLCEQVLSFKLIFYDKEGREREEWDSEDDDYDNSTPAAVGVELKLGGEETPYDFKTTISLPMRRFISPKR